MRIQTTATTLARTITPVQARVEAVRLWGEDKVAANEADTARRFAKRPAGLRFSTCVVMARTWVTTGSAVEAVAWFLARTTDADPNIAPVDLSAAARAFIAEGGLK